MFDHRLVELHIGDDARAGRCWHAPNGCQCADCREARSGGRRLEPEENRHRTAAVRTFAMAVVARTTEEHTRLMELSRQHQVAAGVTITEDDPAVQDLILQYCSDDTQEAQAEAAETEYEALHPGVRCPPRE